MEIFVGFVIIASWLLYYGPITDIKKHSKDTERAKFHQYQQTPEYVQQHATIEWLKNH